MRIRDRIRINFGSGTLSFLVYAIGQLLLIPVFLRHWSPALMGEWMVLWSVPTMIWAVEQMMTGAAVNRMIHLHTQAKTAEAGLCLHHLLFLHACFTAFLMCLALLCYFSLPVADWLKLQEISISDARFISAIIFTHMALMIFSNVIRMPFSALGKLWLGTFQQTVASSAILVIQVVLLWNPSTAQPLTLAFGILGMHGLCVVGLVWQFYRFCGPYTLAWKRPTSDALRTIVADNLPLMGFTFSQSLMVQTFMISIQLSLGPYYVSAFSVLKTLSRAFYQGSNIVLNATGPDLTSAVARHDLLTIRRIGQLQLVFILPAFLLFTCLAILFHNFFLNWWTHGKVSFSNQEILIFLSGVFFLALWSKQSQLLLATLQHRTFYGVAFGLSLLYAGSVFGMKSFLSFDGFLVGASLFEACLYFISRIQIRAAKKVLMGGA